MKRYARELCQQLEQLGFDHIWTNADGNPCYAHPDDPAQTELSVRQNCSENGVRALLRRAQRIARTTPDPLAAGGKRHAAQLKERAAAQRERARNRVTYAAAAHRRLLAARAAPAILTAARALVEQRQRELAAVEHLMHQPPAGGNTHRGTDQARHYTGPPA